MTRDRKDQLFDEMIGWICEAVKDSKDLYILLHDHFELNLVYSGKACLQLDTETRLLDQWDLCLVAPDFPHSLSVDDEDSLILTFQIRRSSFDRIFGNLFQQLSRNCCYVASKSTLTVGYGSGKTIEYLNR